MKKVIQKQVNIDRCTKKQNGKGFFLKDDLTKQEVEIPFSLPGDVINAKLFKKRHGVYQGVIEEIVTPSPDRIQPRCVHFGVCGGCRLQHIFYENQLKKKEELIKDLFSPFFHKISPIVSCLPPWHYRNKMEFSFSSDSSGKKYVGLVIDSSRGKVLNLTECHLVNPWMVQGLKAVRQWWHESHLDAYHPHKNTGSLRTLIFREGKKTGDRMAMLTVSGNPEYALNAKDLEGLVAFLRDAIEPSDPESQLSIFLRIQQIAKGSPTNFYEMVLHGSDHIREILHIQTEAEEEPTPLTFTISPSAFFQPNTQQAEKLYSLAIQLAKIPDNAVVYDLYCGTGTLGICVAKKAKFVVGIELSPESSLDARTNAKNMNLNNIDIITGDVGTVLKQIVFQNYPKPDVVMVDPPRVGLDANALLNLVQLNAPKIIYISCNPATQVENISYLINYGYTLDAIQPVDQFPQTAHIENIAILTKKNC